MPTEVGLFIANTEFRNAISTTSMLASSRKVFTRRDGLKKVEQLVAIRSTTGSVKRMSYAKGCPTFMPISKLHLISLFFDALFIAESAIRRAC